MKLTPAEVVLQIFGGPRETGRILGIGFQTVARWSELGKDGKPMRRSGMVPVHHFQTLLAAAKARGKHLTLDDLVFGREPQTEGVVIVKDGRKVEIKMHDRFDYMTATLTMAGG